MRTSWLLLAILPALAAGSESSSCYTLADSPGCPDRNELGVTTQASAAACQALCDADCTCISYEYWPDSSQCQLSTSCTAAFMDPADGSTWQLHLKNESCWCSPPPTAPPTKPPPASPPALPSSPPFLPPPSFPPPSAPGVCPNSSAASDLEVSLSPSTVQLDGSTTPITVGGCALAPGDTVALVPKAGFDAACDVLVHVLDGERGHRSIPPPTNCQLLIGTTPLSLPPTLTRPPAHPMTAQAPRGSTRRRCSVNTTSSADAAPTSPCASCLRRRRRRRRRLLEAHRLRRRPRPPRRLRCPRSRSLLRPWRRRR